MDEDEEVKERKICSVLVERESVLEEIEKAGGGVSEKGEEERRWDSVGDTLRQRES